MDSSSPEQLKSQVVLDELKRMQRLKEIVDVEEQRVKVVIFCSGANLYGFYGSDIREILPSCDISWVPGLPEHLPGLVNIRGDIESVIDIRYLLGEEKAGAGAGLIAMAVRGDFHSGMMIDAIKDVVDIPLRAIHPPLGTLNGAARDLVCGETEFAGRLVTLLDVGKLAALIAL